MDDELMEKSQLSSGVVENLVELFKVKVKDGSEKERRLNGVGLVFNCDETFYKYFRICRGPVTDCLRFI